MNTDKIVLESLKYAYRYESVPKKIDHADEWIDPDEALLNALNKVISYYSNHEEYQEWIVEKMNLRGNR